MNNSMNFDLRELVESARNALSSRMGTMGPVMQKPSKTDLRLAVLNSLSGESKNGKEVIQAIAISSANTWVPSSSEVYPLLEELTDEGLLSIKIDGERRVYKVTKAGSKALAEETAKREVMPESSAKTTSGSRVQQSGHLLKSSSALAHAISQVLQNGSPAQQDKANKAVEEARKKIYTILAEG